MYFFPLSAATLKFSDCLKKCSSLGQLMPMKIDMHATVYPNNQHEPYTRGKGKKKAVDSGLVPRLN